MTKEVMLEAGIEPATSRLQVECSTNELFQRDYHCLKLRKSVYHAQLPHSHPNSKFLFKIICV